MGIPLTHSVDIRVRAGAGAAAYPYDAIGSSAGRAVEEYPSGNNYDRTVAPQQEEQFGQTICWLKDCIAGLHTVVDNMDYEL